MKKIKSLSKRDANLNVMSKTSNQKPLDQADVAKIHAARSLKSMRTSIGKPMKVTLGGRYGK